jgi:hypothetical protein
VLFQSTVLGPPGNNLALVTGDTTTRTQAGMPVILSARRSCMTGYDEMKKETAKIERQIAALSSSGHPTKVLQRICNDLGERATLKSKPHHGIRVFAP